MATVDTVLRTCGTVLVFIDLCLCLSAARHMPTGPSIRSFSVTYINNSKSLQDGELVGYVVRFRGVGFFGNMHWKITSKTNVYGSTCEEYVDKSDVREVEATDDKYVAEIGIPVTNQNVYFCLFSKGRWIHQGEQLTFVPSLSDNTLPFHSVYTKDKQYKNTEDYELLSSSSTTELTESDSDIVTDSGITESSTDSDSDVLSNDRNDIPNTSFLKNSDNNYVESGIQEKDLNELTNSNYVNYNVLSVIANNGDNVPGDIGMSSAIHSVDKLDVRKLGIREPVVIDVSNELSDKMYKEEKQREYLDKNDNFYGNLDETNLKTELFTPTNEWVDLSHDIDVNYDESAKGTHEKDIVPKDVIYTFVNDKRHNGEPINDYSANIFSIYDKREDRSQVEKENYETNTWKHFQDSSSRDIPSHWIDLSHDIDVNYPIPGSDIVLDVEGDDVEKNIFDKDFEELETDTSSQDQEFEDILEASNVDTTTNKNIHVTNLETMSKRNDQIVEAINSKQENYLSGKEALEASVNTPRNFDQSNDVMQEHLSYVDRRKREIDSNSRTPQSLTTGVLEAVTRSHILPKEEDIDTLRVLSLRIEATDKDPAIEEDGVPQLLAGTNAILRIFGTGFTENTVITFTHEPQVRGGPCQFPVTRVFPLEKETITHRIDKDRFSTAKVKISLPSGDGTFYLCAKRPTASVDNSVASPELIPFVHQGSEPWLQIRTFDKLLPLWASLIIIATCLMFSALFSGLNLGLMSLDRTELKILCNTGTEKEKEYARVIQPVRDHGNFLLCSILLGNVAVNSTFTILLDDLTSGVVAVICSTITIVLLGEITPQAICSRYGLAVGAKTIHITKAVMVLTFPVSYPVSKLLDFLLGEEIGNVYNRERLKELVRVTNDINDLDKDEVNIISGALEMRRKTVLEIMTKIDDVFMLDYEAVLDFETVSEIMKSGFSRIPVYENQRSNIVAMLYVKDLAFVDPDDNTPLKTLCQFYQNPCNFVFEDVTLDVIFKQFKEGHKGHLAFVQRVNSEGEGDPFYETVGLVTLEDVIEELIQAEIMDETDVFTDNRSKRKRNHPLNKLQDFGVFAERRENQRIRISPQLTLATFQYLSTSVDAFKSDNVSETILRRLLKQDVIHHVKFRNKERQKLDPTTLIYEQGKPVDYFVLILEGRVEVTVGKENLMFESGPFTYFGTQALTQNVGVVESPVVPPSALGSLQSINMDSMLRYTFVPDYSVRAVTEVFYVSIKRSLYMAAKRATLMERCSGSRHKGSEDAGEQFDDEVEKLLHSLEEEGSPVTTARSPSHHLNSSRHASPLGPNGSIKTSRQSSPAKQAPVAQQEPEFMDTTPTLPQETSTLLPHS